MSDDMTDAAQTYDESSLGILRELVDYFETRLTPIHNNQDPEYQLRRAYARTQRNKLLTARRHPKLFTAQEERWYDAEVSKVGAELPMKSFYELQESSIKQADAFAALLVWKMLGEMRDDVWELVTSSTEAEGPKALLGRIDDVVLLANEVGVMRRSGRGPST